MNQPTSRLERFVDDALTGDINRFDKSQRRTRIIAATILECSQNSFQAAAMAGIAKRARVSTASLYRDFGTREKLLEEATIFAAPLIAAELVEKVTDTHPRARLVNLLIRHCDIFNHPHASWIYRAHVSGELPDDTGLRAYGKTSRNQIEAFWMAELNVLQDSGYVAIPDLLEAVNFLLGAVQRRTLIAMLLFGDDDVSEPDLITAATSAVDWLLGQFGTQKLREALAP